MKTRAFHFRNLLLVLLAAGFFSSCQKDEAVQPVSGDLSIVNDFQSDGIIIPGKYIVTFREEAVPKEFFATSRTPGDRQAFVRQFAAEVLADHRIASPEFTQVYDRAVIGFAASLSDEDANMLRSDARVKLVEPDQFISLGKKPNPNSPPPPPGQTTPWGITRVGGKTNYSGTNKAWIIDTGIDLDHPDLNVNAQASVTMIGGNSTPDDQNGHGTHVSGTIGALNNTIGVIGVAPGVELISVRVLDRRGSGTVSNVVAGVNWVANHASAGDVANMSLGGGVSTTLDNAVSAAANGGVNFVLAAGNSATDANNSSPARVNGAHIFTISAMDNTDYWAYFSNYGSAVDWCAPGVSVYSTWKGGGYNTISGTSMAAPHISGVILANAGNPVGSGTVQGDPDGNADPIGHTN